MHQMSWFCVSQAQEPQFHGCFCVDKQCSPQLDGLTLICTSDAGTQLILLVQISGEPVTRTEEFHEVNISEK